MDSDSRDVLMRTAERLFAEQGISAVSLRMINRESGQKNHSAVHYHFGEKMGLLEAICDDRAPALAALRTKHLGPVIELDEDDLTLELVMQALVLPIGDYLDAGGAHYLGLRHQMLLSTDADVRLLSKTRDDHEPMRQLRKKIAVAADHLHPDQVSRRLDHIRLLNGAIIAELVALEPNHAEVAASYREQIPGLVQELAGMLQAHAPS